MTASPITATIPARPFLSLQRGDVGVREVDGIIFTTQDVGLLTVALVRPIFSSQIRTIDAPMEIEHFKDFSHMPIIPDDAYLNLVCLPQASVSATIFFGLNQSVWG